MPLFFFEIEPESVAPGGMLAERSKAIESVYRQFHANTRSASDQHPHAAGDETGRPTKAGWVNDEPMRPKTHR